jgi:predicted outer membrane repeat protein
MVKPYDLIRPFVAIMLFTLLQPCKAQVNNDSIPTDTNEFQVDEIHDFHRKKADILNYLLVDNFNNSALAGSLKSYQAQATFGNNLPGSPNNLFYGQIMLDMFFGNKQGRHGLAYRMGMNHSGYTTTISQRFDYSFQILNKQNVSLRAGVGVGFAMDQNIPGDFTYGDMIDNQYGFIYAPQETYQNSTTRAFQVTKFQWNAGAQLRIHNAYINIYNNNIQTTKQTINGEYFYIPGIGVNSLYNIQLKKMQIVPSIQFNYYSSFFSLVKGGVLLASNTSKGGGGGIYYDNRKILGITGMFAWDDYLHVYAQVQIPTSELVYSYPVTNFQLTVSYKINDFTKYE